MNAVSEELLPEPEALGLLALLLLQESRRAARLSPDGDVLLFEANATMVINKPPEDAMWDYRRAATINVQAATRRMFMDRLQIDTVSLNGNTL